MSKERFTLETKDDDSGKLLSAHLQNLEIDHDWIIGIEEQGAPLPIIYVSWKTFYGNGEVWGFLTHEYPEKFGIEERVRKREREDYSA